MVPVGAGAAPGGAGILASTRRRFLRIGVTKAQPEPMKTLTPSVAELQREHVTMELECIDRMYLNAYRLSTGFPKPTNAETCCSENRSCPLFSFFGSRGKSFV